MTLLMCYYMRKTSLEPFLNLSRKYYYLEFIYQAKKKILVISVFCISTAPENSGNYIRSYIQTQSFFRERLRSGGTFSSRKFQ